MHLYETHLPVRDTGSSLAFYRDVVGLEFAHHNPERDVVFLWIGTERRSMLGLWGPATTYGSHHYKQHFAIAVSLSELIAAGRQLNEKGVVTRNFTGAETTEPSVIGWMPSAQLYFDDPDGHVIEFISLLDDEPDAAFVGPISQWKRNAWPNSL